MDAKLLAERLAAARTPAEGSVIMAEAWASRQGERMREVLHAAAVPHWFDPEILAALLEVSQKEADAYCETLRTFPFVVTTSGQVSSYVHEKTRLAVLEVLAREDAENFRQLSARAYAHFSRSATPQCMVEAIFHQLVADPEGGTEALETIFKKCEALGAWPLLQTFMPSLQERLQSGQLSGRTLGVVALVQASIALSYRPLAEVIPLLDQGIAAAKAANDKRLQSGLLDVLGGAYLDQGNRLAAIEALYAAKAIDEESVLLWPGNSNFKMALAQAHGRLGRFHEAAEEWPEALAAYEAAIAILEPIAKSNSADTRAQADLEATYTDVGDVQLGGKKDLQAAQAAYEAAREIVKKLTSSESQNPTWQLRLALSHGRIGSIQHLRGNSREAREAFESGLAIAKVLVGSDPEQTELQHTLAIMHLKVGSTYRTEGNLPAALRSFEAALSIYEQLTGHDPSQVQWQKQWGIVQTAIHSTREMIVALADKPLLLPDP